jgi:soluble lytic murein transglycosylase-like protein
MWDKLRDICDFLLVFFAFVLLLAWFDYVRADDTPESLKIYAYRIELKYELPPGLLAAVCEQESDWRNVRGQHGEIGVCQLKPSTARMLCPDCKDIEKLLANPRANVTLAAAYLAWIKRTVSSDPAIIMAAYNRGPNSSVVRYMVMVQQRMAKAVSGTM